MNQKKTVFIIPGFKQKPTQKAYKKLIQILQKEGYYTVSVTLPWKQRTISENTTLFLRQYNKLQRKKKYILGFSFGAMIAFLAATKVRTAGLILCSLSPYFKEDVAKERKSDLSSLMQHRYRDFSRLHGKTLAKQIKTKQILMLYGVKEAESLIKRVKKTFKQISSKRKFLIPILEVEHNIGDKRYLHMLHQITKILR